MMAEEPEDISTDTAEDSANEAPAEDSGADLLGGLESLLAEEGEGLDLPDDDLSENDLTDLFDDDEDEEESGEGAAPVGPRAAESSRDTRRRERSERNRRDREDYHNLESHLQATPLGLEISEDKMTARVNRITAESTIEQIHELIRQQKITFGIDEENIRSAIAKSSRGQNQFEVTVARGKAPRVMRNTEVRYHMPTELITGTEDAKTDFERLKVALEGPYLEACKSWRGPVRIVGKGDVISEILPAEVAPGTNVFGEEMAMGRVEDVTLEVGDHVTLSEDGQQTVADLYGYVGLIGGVPTVLSPIWVSSDHMEARFIFHKPAEPPPVPTEEDLHELLEMKWIEYGVMERQLELITIRLGEKQALPVTVPIAQGTPEIQGEDAQVKFAFDPYELMKWNQLQSLLSLKAPEAIQLGLTDIYEGGASTEEDDEDHSGIRFKAVRPGEVVVEKIPATTGVIGQDIQGEEVVADEGKDQPLEVGEGLQINDEELRATSAAFGYIALRWDIEVNVISPLWISPDRTTAFFLNLPQSGAPKYPSVEELTSLLEGLEITHGFVPERWAEILEDLRAGKRTREFLLPIAQGTSPVGGRDAQFEWSVQIDNDKPGKIMEDGSIDFRDRNMTTVAQEGDLLGKLIPPKPGKGGMDIYGNELKPPQPLNIEVVTDSRIYAEPEEDGSMAFFCETGGGISSDEELKTVKGRRHMRINIGVYPITNIEGDVDYSTGNIDFNGDVVIGGSVQSQFSVKATGTVTIGGYVEAGAYVTAGKDILIARGVVGTATELVAGGDIMSKFIQEATVRATGTVKVGSYIFNASVRAGGEVQVPGMGEGKSRALVGGLIWGAQGVTARSIGSPYNTSTRLVVGVDPDQVNRADQIRANMHTCDNKQRALLKKLGVEHLDLDLIKQKLARVASAKQKQQMLMAVKRIAKIAELERNQQEELEEIAEEQRKLAQRTQINVLNDLFAGVEIRIGEHTELIREDAEKCSFRLVTEDEEQKIFMDGLRNTPRMG
ncbi:MAG: DUF342 domain-containing protein [Gemmatimonadetes bacterium]|jgi:uncharacterized protein|nr:DUF342 domain-containing protein [Gemmatimonadota bacterium]MBT6144798.1 DUF342 domain-containing protein [Gemmatimonadota bacterium]MBT7859743.1 DUF342 domain-containing protein [Gemmatimonadota bacterium]